MVCFTLAVSVRVRLGFGKGLASARASSCLHHLRCTADLLAPVAEGAELRDASHARRSALYAGEKDARDVPDFQSLGSSAKSSGNVPPPRMAID